MSHLAEGVQYIALAAALLCVLAAVLKRYRNKRLAKSTFFLGFMLLGWLIAEIGYHLAPAGVDNYFSDFNLPFAALFAFGSLVFVLRFYGYDAYLTRSTIFLLSIIPSLTVLLTLTGRFHALLYVEAHGSMSGRSVWFWLQVVYGYVLQISALFVALAQYPKVPPLYRTASRQLVAGVSLPVAAALAAIPAPDFLFHSLLLTGCAVSFVFLFLSIRNNQGLDFLNRARSEIFNELSEGVMILDDENRVTSRNLSAKYTLYQAGLDPEEASYETILETVFKDAARQPLPEKESGVDYTFDKPSGPVVINLREKPILDKRGRKIGTVTIYTDVSESHAAIHQLEMQAGLDAITGLLNRRMIGQRREELDIPANLPLAVIVCDVNNLKKVNDTLGHQLGDALLREAAEALTACSPPNACLGRTGGDEFLLLIPHFYRVQALGLMSDIREHLKHSHNKDFCVSIALGACIKESPEQDLGWVIQCADGEMYEDKRRYK